MMPHLTPLEVRVVDTILGRRDFDDTGDTSILAPEAFEKVADVVLRSTAQGPPLLGENAAARIARLAILAVVFAAVARPDLRAAEWKLAATRDAVTAKRPFSSPRRTSRSWWWSAACTTTSWSTRRTDPARARP
jgi:hypothetical protein